MAITDLTYLHEYSSDDKDFVIEMIELFLSSTPGFLDEMQSAFDEKNYVTVGRIAHKIKPSMTFMGIKNGKELTIELEEYAVDASDVGKIEEKMKELKSLCNSAFAELNQSLQELKS